MRQFQNSVTFHQLYLEFRSHCPVTGVNPTLGRFLCVLDPQILELLSQRMHGFFEGELEAALIDDLVYLTKAIAFDEDYLLPDVEDVVQAAHLVADAVVSARLNTLGLGSADIQTITLTRNDDLATRSSQVVTAPTGTTSPRSFMLH